MEKRLLYLTKFICIEYGPAMIEDIILEAKLDPNMKVATDFDSSEGGFIMIVSLVLQFG